MKDSPFTKQSPRQSGSTQVTQVLLDIFSPFIISVSVSDRIKREATGTHPISLIIPTMLWADIPIKIMRSGDARYINANLARHVIARNAESRSDSTY